ncbi:hypothetical protein JRQ81_019468, partial [Phrynocephalus forsythii]
MKQRGKKGVSEVEITQMKLAEELAFLEMRQRQQNIRFRLIPWEEGEDIKAKVITELAKWLGWQEEEVAGAISQVFRIAVRSKKLRAKKTPGDVIVSMTSMAVRDRILKHSYDNRFVIEGQQILIYKEIPLYFLRRRGSYKPLAETLRRNGLRFRWEFPEGLSFIYKMKRFKITSELEIGKFLRKYGEELGYRKPSKEGDRLPEEKEDQGSRRGEGEEEEEEEEEELELSDEEEGKADLA